MSITWGQLGDNLIANASKKRIPISGTFELTSRCNLQCKMCYICKPANDKDVIMKERSADEWIHLAEQARDEGMLYLLLTGGEVFLRQDFKEIYEAISMMGFNIKIYTNATMITPEIAKWIGLIPPSSIEVTLYGASPETYLSVCGVSEGFERALNGIDLLLAQGINVRVRTTVIKDNANDFVKLAQLTEERGIKISIVNYISPRREGCNTNPNENRLSPDELIKYEFSANTYFQELERKAHDNQIEDCIERRDNQNNQNEKTLFNETEGPFKCSVGKSTFWITWDGRMVPCGMMQEPAADPLKQGFFNSWNELKLLSNNIPVCKECKVCSVKEYCMSCPARLKNETGLYHMPAAYLCEAARERQNYVRLSRRTSTKQQ